MNQGIPAIIASMRGTPRPPYRQFKVKNTTADTSSTTITFDLAPLNGNLIILIASSGSVLNLPTPATWAKDSTEVADLETSVYSKISNGSEQTITITTTTSPGTIQLVAIEFPAGSYTTFDKTAIVTRGIASSLNFNTTPTTTGANEIIIAVGALNLGNGSGDCTPTISWSNGFQELSFTGAKNGGSTAPFAIMLGVALFVATSTGTFTTLWTFTDSGATLGVCNAVIVTYK